MNVLFFFSWRFFPFTIKIWLTIAFKVEPELMATLEEGVLMGPAAATGSKRVESSNSLQSLKQKSVAVRLIFSLCKSTLSNCS